MQTIPGEEAMIPRPNRCHSIQPNKPGRPLLPWEQPGYFRLDCQPHRGELLLWLGFCILLAAICFVMPGAVVGVALGTPGLAFAALAGSAVVPLLGGWVYLAARQDLREMAVGRRDPAGEGLTRRGGSSAVMACVLAAVCAALALASLW